MNLKKIVLAVAAIGMTFSVASVSAGELANEFSGLMALGSTKTGATSSSFGYGALQYGRFFSPQFEGVAGVTYAVAAGGSTTGFLVGANYFFSPVGKAGNAAWFVGGDVGSASGGGASTTTVAFNGGVKYFVTETASINATYRYADQKPSTGASTKMNLLLIGASAYF